MFKFNNYIAIFGNTIFSFFWSPLQIAAYMDRQPSWIYLILIHLLPHMALYNLRCYLELLAVPLRPCPRPRKASGALGVSRGRERNGPEPPSTQAPRTWGRGGPWVLLARDMGVLWALWGREGKGPKPPGTWGPSRGPKDSHVPGQQDPDLG